MFFFKYKRIRVDEFVDAWASVVVMYFLGMSEIG